MRNIAFLQIQYGSEKDPNKYGGKKIGDNPIKRGDGLCKALANNNWNASENVM